MRFQHSGTKKRYIINVEPYTVCKLLVLLKTNDLTYKNSVTRVCQGNRPNVVQDLPQITTKSGSIIGNVSFIVDSTKVFENSSSLLQTVLKALTNCNLECLDVSILTTILGSHLYPKKYKIINMYIYKKNVHKMF